MDGGQNGGVRRRRTFVRIGVVSTVAFALAAGLLMFTKQAQAVTTCNFNPLTGVVSVSADGPASIRRDPTTGIITVNGLPCLGATGPAASVTTTDQINVTGGVSDDLVTIDLSGGPFAPGKSAETGACATPEIEFTVGLAAGADSLIVSGTTGSDYVAFADGVIALNKDDDTDIDLDASIESLSARTLAGNDELYGWWKACADSNSVRKDISKSLSLDGGTGDDTIGSGAGDDAIEGGAGSDTVTYSEATNGVTVDLAAGTASGHGSDDLTGIENADGSSFDDYFVDADGVRNRFRGFAGNDSFQAGLEKPTFDAPDKTPGSPTFNQSDEFDGGEGEHDIAIYRFTKHNSPGEIIDLPGDKVFGSDEYDSIPNVEDAEGSGGDDKCIDQDGERNICKGGAGDDRFEAGTKKPVNDAPDENGKSDTWDGGDGNDTVSYKLTEHNSPGEIIDLPGDKVFGSPEYDEIPNVENAEGSGGDDRCIDQDGERNMCALGEGDDYFEAGEKKPGNDAPDKDPGSPTFNRSDTWDGGPGNDTVSYSKTEHNSPGEIIDLPGDKVFGSPEHDLIPNVENPIGSGGDDVIILQDFNVPGVPASGVQVNIAQGLAGDDEFKQTGDATHGDQMLGGEGFDSAKAELMTAPGGVRCDLPANQFDAGTPDFFDGENCGGSNADDVLVGDADANVMLGGGGDDSIDCAEGADTVSFADAPNGVSVDMGTGTATGFGNDTFVNCETALGSNFDDTMLGGEGRDRMDGGGGADAIRGGSQDDVLFGGAGDDVLDGENGSDELHGGSGDDELHGGSNGKDTVFGDEGNDKLFGGNGPDYLDGGEEPDGSDDFDEIDGGEGPDTCVNGESVTNCEQQGSGTTTAGKQS